MMKPMHPSTPILMAHEHFDTRDFIRSTRHSHPTERKAAMSEFQVRVVCIGAIRKHPNADSLSITELGGEGGYPVILRTGEFKEGDLAVYVPITALLSLSDPRWAFLKPPPPKDGGEGKPEPTHHEVEPKRLRGVYSMGLLTAAEPGWVLGQDVAEALGIVRAEPPEPTEGNERDPGLLPVYTDIAGLRAHPNLLREGEEVVITEKIHGECARYVYGNGRLYAGSRVAWKDPAGEPFGGVPGKPLHEHSWWEVARRLKLEERLRDLRYAYRLPNTDMQSAAIQADVGIFGEVYGNVPDMKYDGRSDQRGLRLFDAMRVSTRTYMDHDEFVDVAKALDLSTAPVLYRGPWTRDLRALAEGNSTFAGHVREGLVVKPVHERFDETVGRVILKLHGEGYHLRKKKKVAT